MPRTLDYRTPDEADAGWLQVIAILVRTYAFLAVGCWLLMCSVMVANWFGEGRSDPQPADAAEVVSGSLIFPPALLNASFLFHATGRLYDLQDRGRRRAIEHAVIELGLVLTSSAILMWENGIYPAIGIVATIRLAVPAVLVALLTRPIAHAATAAR